MIRRTKLTFDAQRWKAEKALAREGLSVMVCAGTGCIASGAMAVYETLHRLCKEKGLPVSVSLSEHADDAVHLKKTGCHGFCEIGPLVNISPMNVYPCQARGLRGNHRKDHKGRQGDPAPSL